MTTIYEAPNEEQLEAASKANKEWMPIEHLGKVTHWVLVKKRVKKKPCNCGKKKGDHFR